MHDSEPDRPAPEAPAASEDAPDPDIFHPDATPGTEIFHGESGDEEDVPAKPEIFFGDDEEGDDDEAPQTEIFWGEGDEPSEAAE